MYVRLYKGKQYSIFLITKKGKKIKLPNMYISDTNYYNNKYKRKWDCCENEWY